MTARRALAGITSAPAAPPGGTPTWRGHLYQANTSGSGTWVMPFTPQVGSTIVLLLFQRTTAGVVQSIGCVPDDLTFVPVANVPPSGTSDTMRATAYISTVLTTQAVEHTATVNWSPNARGGRMIHEWSPAQMAAQGGQGVVTDDGVTPIYHSGVDITQGVTISASLGIYCFTGNNYSDMDAPYVRADTLADSIMAAHYVEDFTPGAGERGEIGSSFTRAQVGLYLPLAAQ